MKKYTHLNEVSIDETFSDSGFVLGVDENGDIKRVPKGTMGKVKSVNGNESDENGDIKVCEALKDVGKQGFEPLTNSDGSLTYDFLLGSWTGIDMPNLYYIMGGMGLNYDSTVRCFKVILDGVTYVCPTHLVQEDGTAYTYQYIGNGSMRYETEEDNGLPFIIYVENDSWFGKVASDGEHDCQVYGGIYTTTQVPEELVPQSVIVINKNNLSDYKAIEIKKLLKIGKMVHIVEYVVEADGWTTYVPSGYSMHEDGDYIFDAVVFTSLYSNCSSIIYDSPRSIDSVTCELKVIMLHERFENGYTTFSKILS